MEHQLHPWHYEAKESKSMSSLSLQERVAIQALASQGQTDQQISADLKLNVHTVRKWRRRGSSDVVSPMGRPPKGALSSYSPTLVNQLKEWREKNPGWGPVTLHTELKLLYPDQKLPATASISRWLKQEKYARSYDHHLDLLETTTRRAPEACHEEWELDARSPERIPSIGVIGLIDLNDVFSRVKIASYPIWLGEKRATHHPTTADYQLVLRLAFCEWGLPDQLSVDHDSVFYDNRGKSPFPTHFHLWLLALGVKLAFGRFHRPTDQAITERSHQTWDHQVLEGHAFSSHQALCQALSKRRSFLNEHLPCASLQDQPPLVAHPEALRPRRHYRPEWEIESLDMEKVHAYLAQGRWFRKVSSAGTVSLGRSVYYLSTSWKRQEVAITFDPDELQLVFTLPGKEPKHLPLLNFTARDLMGEFGSLSSLIHFQLALPMAWKDWRASYLVALVRGTNL
jgi:hypothetical protein